MTSITDKNDMNAISILKKRLKCMVIQLTFKIFYCNP